jgi:hypothetical protein
MSIKKNINIDRTTKLTGEICMKIFVLDISGLLWPAKGYNNTYRHRGPRNDDPKKLTLQYTHSSFKIFTHKGWVTLNDEFSK